MSDETTKTSHFIEKIIEQDIQSNKHGGQVITRFPPEPNGFLHIGHAKSICLNFEIAKQYGGYTNLRFDDTNPCKEESKYADAIAEDVRWLGYEWADEIYHASDYFDELYACAVELIKLGKAYVCELDADAIRETRGTLQKPGTNSPYRDRSIEENLTLFTAMKNGEFEDGKAVLRAKIDMNSGNINMRDPIIYRVRHISHHRTGNKWCVYPMYDYTHCLSDWIENITHSLCTLEFQDHRPLYNWCLETLGKPNPPQQIEFARLNVSHAITSKRKLKQLVDEAFVDGWDDPRMPTISGLRQRGYPPEAIRNFCKQVGISKSDSLIDMSLLEETVRTVLNDNAARAMAVLNPIKITIENYPEDETETLTAAKHPKQDLGQRSITWSKHLYIEREDFMQEPPKKFHRLAPGKEVRLRNAYVIKCESVITNAEGEVVELVCSYDPETLGKNPEGRKVKGVIHWVSQAHAEPIQVNLYDRLFNDANPGALDNIQDALNPNSLTVIKRAYAEPGLLAAAKPLECYQFERQGYFCLANKQDGDLPIFNRTAHLRDPFGGKR